MSRKRPEIRLNEDKTLDEIVADSAKFHLEQMSDKTWWLSVESGGRRVNVWLNSSRKIAANFDDEPA